MRKGIFGLVAGLALTGCATIDSSQLATQYTTLKLLESERVTQDQVTEAIARVRPLLEYGVAVDLAELQTAIDWQALAPSDRLLVSALVGDLELEVNRRLSEDTQAALLLRLDWIEQAAALAGD